MTSDFRVLFTKTDWVLNPALSLEERLKIAADQGFDGLETFSLPEDPIRFSESVKSANMICQAGFIAPSAASFRTQLTARLKFNPALINVHGGRDTYRFDESLRYFRECIAIAKGETDVPVVFETHRATSLYAPWVAEDLLDALPELRLCADFSHYTCVTSSDMETSLSEFPGQSGFPDIVPDSAKQRMMDKLIDRSDHIHARVGDMHRPQVVDPRIGEGLEWTGKFESWWDRIVARARNEGRGYLTIDPEFGPVPYAPADPDTNAPFADPDALAVWMKDRLRARYS